MVALLESFAQMGEATLAKHSRKGAPAGAWVQGRQSDNQYSGLNPVTGNKW